MLAIMKVSNILLIIVININVYISYSNCNSVNNSFTPPQLRSGGWTPIPTLNNKNYKSGEKLSSDSSQVSSKLQQQTTEPKKTQDSEMLPIPVIKPHRHGATLGFDLPDQGLTLYLDINELATKPLAQNIGLKVVSHDSHQAQPSSQPLNHAKPNAKPNANIQSRQQNTLYNSNESPLSQFVHKMQTSNNAPKAPKAPKAPITVAKIQKRVKTTRNIGSYEGNGGSSGGNSGGSGPAPAVKPPTVPKPAVNKYHVGYMRPLDLQNALKQVGLTHSGNQLNNQNKNSNIQNKNQNPSTRTVIINTHSLVNNNNNNNQNYNNNNKQTNGQKIDSKIKSSALDSFNPNPNKYFSTPLTFQSNLPQISLNNNFVPQTNHKQQNANRPSVSSSPQSLSYTQSSLQLPIRPSTQYPVQEKEPDVQRPHQEPEEEAREETPVQQTAQEEEHDFVENEVAVGRTTTPAPVLPPQEEDVQQTGFDDDVEQSTQSIPDNRFEEPQRQVSYDADSDDQKNYIKQTVSMPLPTTNAHFTPSDDTIVKPFPAPSAAVQQDLTDIPVPNTCASIHQMCGQTCDAKTDNLITDASNIREIIHKLNADSLINTFPTLEVELQNIIDFASTNGYTIILPSNEAVSRLPPNLFEFWKNNVNSLAPLLDNHVIESAQSLEEMRQSAIIQPRSGAKLRVNRAHNDSYTINGERVQIANQVGPNGGTIHVIDGILYPNSDKDIMETLKSCNRLDGFVTLAEGTGFADSLKQSGPFTVFVPSNEALQKVPDNDLDIIRNNMTALREFLKYHVALGAHYSNDLRDGQFIPSLIDGQYIQVGVRVDGCRRRLVEANVSPLYRADIPASNGVIHVVDWILKPTDRDWCENVILPR